MLTPPRRIVKRAEPFEWRKAVKRTNIENTTNQKAVVRLQAQAKGLATESGRIMKKIVKLIVIGAIGAVGIVQANAQTNTNTATHQIVHKFDIELKGYTEGATVRVSNKEILKVLSAVYNEDFTKGQLMAVTVEDEDVDVVVRRKGKDD